MTRIRVMTYNVRSMRDDRDALGRVLRAAEPDVVLVQEAPRFLRWRTLCAQLARRAGLVVVGGGRPAGANLVLCALGVDVESAADVLFSADPGLHRRGASVAVLRKDGTRFAVAGTHLDLVAAARLRHVDELDRAVADQVPAGVPIVVAGDINDRPGSPVWDRICRSRTDVLAAAGTGSPFTSTAARPYQTIDGIFVDPAITPVAARVPGDPDVLVASDHRPVVADLEFESNAGGVRP